MMQCPYCGKEMLDGKLLGDHKALKWLPKDKQMLFGLVGLRGIDRRLPCAHAARRSACVALFVLQKADY